MMQAAGQVPDVLHICSDYARQEVYRELVAALGALGIAQSVFVPVRTAGEVDRNRVEGLDFVRYRFAHLLRPYHRVFFHAKVRRVFDDLRAWPGRASPGLIHAHFLYSDGAVALRLSRELGVPYVVAVRNTDLNAFMRWRPDLLPVAIRVLEGASRIVCLSPAYRSLLLQRLPASVQARVLDRLIVLPNGLADWWLDRPPVQGAVPAPGLRLLYVGDFSRNKNIPGILRAAGLLARERPVSLTLVGDGGDGEQAVDTLLAKPEYAFVTRTGRVSDRANLAEIFRSSDVFVMPSFRESFGVTYLEALSQGVPVVHSHGQGIAGYFPSGSVAEAVNPLDPTDIAAGIRRLAARTSTLGPECVAAVQRFRWAVIAREYAGLYVQARSAAGPAVQP